MVECRDAGNIQWCVTQVGCRRCTGVAATGSTAASHWRQVWGLCRLCWPCVWYVPSYTETTSNLPVVCKCTISPSNLTESPHCHHTLTVQLYSSVCSHLIHGYLGHPSPYPKHHLDRFSHFMYSSRQKVPVCYNGLPLTSWQLPLCMEAPGPPHLVHAFPGHIPLSFPNSILIGSAFFAGSRLWQTMLFKL